MKSNHLYNKMLLLLNGELSEEDKRQAEEHLASCSECSTAYAKLKITMSVIDEEKKLEASSFLYAKIQNSLDILKESKETYKSRPSMVNILKPVYISLLIVFAVFTGMLVGNNLNVSKSSVKSKTNYTINSTKDFYILGVDNESN